MKNRQMGVKKIQKSAHCAPPPRYYYCCCHHHQ